MRLISYFLVTIGILVMLSYFGQPLQKYVNRVKSDAALGLQQRDLVRIDQRLMMAKNTLIRLQAANPSFMRIRVAFIHSGMTPTGDIVWQWDNVAVVAKPGYSGNDVPLNKPLSQWNDYLGVLLNGHCAYMITDTIKNDEARIRIQSNGVAAFLVCPIMNSKNQLLGAIFATWHELTDVPVNRQSIEHSVKDAADTIAQKELNQSS
jgi:hypothetical protein